MTHPSILRRAGALIAAGLAAFAVAACGSGDSEPPRADAQAPERTAAPADAAARADAEEHAEEEAHAEEEGEHRFEPGHSNAVREYYGDAHPHADGDEAANVEAEYHQPPTPATGELGDAITLTGINIGVRLRVTPTRVIDPAPVRSPARDGRRRVAVALRVRNTGIAIFESELRSVAITDDRGRRTPVAFGVRADCSNGFHEWMRLDVGLKAGGCLVFDLPASRTPETLQLALESVPVAAGGKWRLR